VVAEPFAVSATLLEGNPATLTDCETPFVRRHLPGKPDKTRIVGRGKTLADICHIAKLLTG
jgi:hypothetical protein